MAELTANRVVPILNTAKDATARLAWLLPHDLRRSLFLRLNPGYADSYETMRTHELGEIPDMTVSLAGFEALEAIFVHIPKNGGSSIGRSLVGKYDGNHMPIRSYQMIYPKATYDRFFKFAFSRNPFDRLLSGYRSMTLGTEPAGPTAEGSTAQAGPQIAAQVDARDRLLKPRSELRGLDRFRDFEHFVTEWATPTNTRRFEHFRPQYRFVCAPDGRLETNFIGRFETMDADLKVIAERLGVETELRHENRTLGDKPSDYTDYYTPRSRRIVERLYGRDLRLFDYGFGD